MKAFSASLTCTTICPGLNTIASALRESKKLISWGPVPANSRKASLASIPHPAGGQKGGRGGPEKARLTGPLAVKFQETKSAAVREPVDPSVVIVPVTVSTASDILMS
jgi:hypothetical protein